LPAPMEPFPKSGMDKWINGEGDRLRMYSFWESYRITQLWQYRREE
jgi:hypothetical protein